MVFRKGKSLLNCLRMKSPAWRAAFYLIASVQPKGLILNYYLEQSPESFMSFFVLIFLRRQLPISCPIFRKEIPAGEACLFPNAFPYDQNNNVAILSSRHFIGLESTDSGDDARRLCRLPRLFSPRRRMNLGYKYCSINWNYMPPAGGGLIHPHLQTIAGHKPTNLYATPFSQRPELRRYYKWRQLMAQFDCFGKKRERKGSIASTGVISWLTSFCAEKHGRRIDFIFPEKTSFFDLTES